MADLSPKKNPWPEQEPDVRNKNFEEVALGYGEEAAVAEAGRCFTCAARPCMKGCPVSVHIPDFIKAVYERKFEEAYQIISQSNALPAVCGRVCPQESQCEGKCVRLKIGEPVGIGRLERFVADWHIAHTSKRPEKVESNGHKVAIVGSGPAGLTCARDLAMDGYEVTIFEAFHVAGGVMIYGIPEFRLPKTIVATEIENLKALGVKIQLNTVVGRTFSFDSLFEKGFEAVFIGTGAGLPQFMGIEGESLLGVYSANEYLTRINLMKAYLPEYDTPIAKSRKVIVVGGGNVAMDAARCAKRIGADVTIVYRRSFDELPARAEEVHHAMEEGIKFQLLTNPTAIYGDESGRVTYVRCVEMELGEPDESGRRSPIPKEDSQLDIEADTVIMALGTSPNPILKDVLGLELNRHGCVIADEDMKTSREGIFAGGDAVSGSATVILAMGTGRKAAASIKKYIENKK